MQLKFHTLHSFQATPISWIQLIGDGRAGGRGIGLAVGAGGESKAGSSIHLNRKKAAIVRVFIEVHKQPAKFIYQAIW